MNNLFLSLVSTIIVGLGATLTFDFWALFLKYVFKVTPSNMCLVGRWILYLPEGIFRHSKISFSPQKKAECIAGWITHYLTGVVFAVIFLVIVGGSWIQQPRLIPAFTFGIVTVFAPFFIMQPLFGHGIAASKTPNPMQARLRSLMNHAMFGIGLYLFALLSNWLL